MSRALQVATLALALAAAVLAGGAAWFARQSAQAAHAARAGAERSALLLRPVLSLDAPAGGAGMRIVNTGVSPALIRHVALALPAADGTVGWLAYPDAANGAQLDLWRFAGLRAAVGAVAPGTAPPVLSPPPAGSVLAGGAGRDLLVFPASLPQDWRAAHGPAADRVLNGLMACVSYDGLDGTGYQFDLRGLCTRAPGDADRRFTGEDAAP